MPTERSSTDQVGRLRRVREATADVRALVDFRFAAVRDRGRTAVRVAVGLLVVLTGAAAWLPAHLPPTVTVAGSGEIRADEMLLLLPAALVGVVVIAVVAAASSGGGRELLPRDQGAAFPVSPTTDHLGALLMAPLNLTWLLQAWLVLAMTAFATGATATGTTAAGSTGPAHLLAAQVPVLLWIVVATALAQLVAWVAEWFRRVPGGVWVVRGAGLVAAGAGAALVTSGRLVPVLDASPTVRVVAASMHGARGDWLPWLATVTVLVVIALAAVAAGGVAAHALARRPAHEETRAETSLHPPRPHPASDLLALLRLDRAGVRRSVPLRRGFAVLAVLPGLAALAGSLQWPMVAVLPGLVASGGALLFGVNAWTLDARGALWRESLPVAPRVVLTARVLVLLEVLLIATGVTLAMAAVRAGVPTAAEASAVGCATVVVTFQVVSGSMRWSVRRPFAVDLRSARATPAPPMTMVGYSTRLALVTTFTALLFVGTAQAPSWHWSVLVAVPFVVVSLFRLARTARAWADPPTRAWVVATVAG